MLRRRVLSLTEYVEGVRLGSRSVLAKAITLAESTLPSDQALFQDVLTELLPLSGKAKRIGISGIPGVGKSTFIESFGMYALEKGHKVAVLAVDPTSARTGGSILGDKTRMTLLSQHPNAFIRPSPTSGNLGGVTKHTREALLLCEAFGFDLIIVETVGVGQSETAVHEMVDFFLVLMLASAGDELQGIKRGILELADLIAINKSDMESPERIRRAQLDYKNALHIVRGATSPSHWQPEVLSCSAFTGAGLPEIWDSVISYYEFLLKTGEFEQKRNNQQLMWMWQMVQDSLMAKLQNCQKVMVARRQLEADVISKVTTPAIASEEILKLFLTGEKLK